MADESKKKDEGMSTGWKIAIGVGITAVVLIGGAYWLATSDKPATPPPAK